MKNPKAIVNVLTFSVFFFLLHKFSRYTVPGESSEGNSILEITVTHNEFPSLSAGLFVMSIYFIVALSIYFLLRKWVITGQYPVLRTILFLALALGAFQEFHHLVSPISMVEKITALFWAIPGSIVLPILLLLQKAGCDIIQWTEI